MAKNIVICSDGTGNTAVKGRGSNVFKLFEAVELRANQVNNDLPRQIVIYDDGVGTEDFKPLKILGGAVGWGLSRNVRQLYVELARSYETGDKIYLFGFSRGAYTVRTLAGLIVDVGLVDPGKVGNDADLRRLAGEAYAAHRKSYRRFGKWRKTKIDDRAAKAFRKNYAVEDETPIEFVGVWDTVDAVGFPLDEIADFWHNVVYPFRFPDTDLSLTVRCARHAIAIDDERRTFHPELWNETAADQETGRIKQVWFSGVHSNVGGGYPKQGMSLVTLVWMMEEAEARGLRFVDSMRKEYQELQNISDKLYDSRAGLAGYYGYKPRDMAKICGKYGAIKRVHISAIERIALGTDSYAPGNVARGSKIATDDPAIRTEFAETIIEKAFREGEGLLSGAKRWVSVWRTSQAIFVMASVLAAALYFKEFGTSGFTDLMSFAGYRRLAGFLWNQPIVLAALVLTFGICHLAARRLARAHSAFWFSFRPDLRSALLGDSKAKAAKV